MVIITASTSSRTALSKNMCVSRGEEENFLFPWKVEEENCYESSKQQKNYGDATTWILMAALLLWVWKLGDKTKTSNSHGRVISPHKGYKTV